jgi:hypothetical protein
VSTQQYPAGFGVLDLSGVRLSEPALPSAQASSTAPLALPTKMQIYTDSTSNAIHSRHPSPSPSGGSDVELSAQSAPKAADSGYYGSTSYYSVFDRADHVPNATTDSRPSGPAGDTLFEGIRGDDDPGVSRSFQLGSWILQNLQHMSVI